jgi:hypothetical protein
MMIFALFFWIIMGGVGYLLGKSKGRALEGFLLGFFFSILGWIVVLLMDQKSSALPCMFCGTMLPKVNDRAIPRCRKCGRSQVYPSTGRAAGPAFIDPLEEQEYREWQARKAAGHNVPPPAFIAAPTLRIPENWESHQAEMREEEEKLDQKFGR